MGNTVTADSSPLALEGLSDIGSAGMVDDEPKLHRGESHVKLWRLSSHVSRTADGVTAVDSVPVSIHPLDELHSSLDHESAYIMLVLRLPDEGGSPAMRGPSLKLVRRLNEVCTPRGLTHPFSTSRTVDTRLQCLIYVIYGRQASKITKAVALRRAIGLERHLREPRAVEHILCRGHPSPVPLASDSEALLSLQLPHFLRPSVHSPSPRRQVASPPPPEVPKISMRFGGSAGTAVPPLPLPSRECHEDPYISVDGDGAPPDSASSESEPVDSPGGEDDTVELCEPQSPYAKKKMMGLSIPKLRSVAFEDFTASPPSTALGASTHTPPALDDGLDEVIERERKQRKLLEYSGVCSEIRPYLCVSGQAPADTLQTLLSSGVTHIINTVAMLVPCKFPKLYWYLPLTLADHPSEQLASLFPHCTAIIDRVRKAKGKTLVHCQQGVSRSCTIATAFLMWLEGKSSEETTEDVRGVRGVMKPNIGFSVSLMEWGEHLQHVRPVQVYSLRPYSSTSLPPVLHRIPLESSTTFNTHGVYAILVWTQSTQSIFLWRGAKAPPSWVRVARRLLPDIAWYDYPTSPLSPSPISWPKELPENPCVVDEGREPDELRGYFEANGWNVPFERVEDSAEGDYQRGEELGREWEGFFARCCDTLLGGDEEERAARREEAVARGGKEEGEVDVSFADLFLFRGGGGDGQFERHTQYGEQGMGEDEFARFQDDMADGAAVFVKADGGTGNLTVWYGQDVDFPDDDIEAEASKVIADFKAWAAKNTPWGTTVKWADIRIDWLRDQDDEEDDDIFQERWIAM